MTHRGVLRQKTGQTVLQVRGQSGRLFHRQFPQRRPGMEPVYVDKYVYLDSMSLNFAGSNCMSFHSEMRAENKREEDSQPLVAYCLSTAVL